MKIGNSRKAMALQIGLAAILLAGCNSAQPPEAARETSTRDGARAAEETRSVAEAALGKEAEVLAHGNLARNDLEQLLVIDRFAGTQPADAVNSAPIFITRAAILERRNGQWTEVLLCDEHLKNPNGYLGGSPAARVTGWRLEFKPDTKQGLEMKFTPANFEAGRQESGTGEPASQSIVVRWNSRAKRYQSLDASQERYLSEAPTLETPHSTLR
jgi:hypothetical protein